MKKEQEYSKTTFNSIAQKYDKIEFFKISAGHVAQIIKREKEQEALEILDVACGTGNVVLECASCLPKASFNAVDISEGMLAVAKANAQSRGLDNIDFHLKDITEVKLEKAYDIITCSYVLFFLPNAVTMLKVLTEQLKPNGKLIFTSFLKEAFSPTVNLLLELLRKHGSTSAKEYEVDKWENLKNRADIEHLCHEAGIEDFSIEAKEIRYDLDLNEWWELLNNTGFKGMLMELSSEDYERTKDELFEALSEYKSEENKIELIADSWFVVLGREEL